MKKRIEDMTRQELVEYVAYAKMAERERNGILFQADKAMKIFTIKQKMSNSGSIYDIASDLYDRDIKFPKGSKFAVILPSYYGGKGYTTHQTAEAAAARYNKIISDGYSAAIIDSGGNSYECIHGYNGDTLIQYYPPPPPPPPPPPLFFDLFQIKARKIPGLYCIVHIF